MAYFGRLARQVIDDADVVLHVLDARMPHETRHAGLERIIYYSGKKLIYVINKCDLVDKPVLEKIKRELENAVFVSATEHLGVSILRSAIMRMGKQVAKAAGHPDVIVGVVGYPNVGKSSVINMLKGKGVASTSSTAGHTRSVQKVRISKSLVLLDSPGVLAPEGTVRTALATIASKNVQQLRDAEAAAMEIIAKGNGAVEAHYGVVRKKGEDECDLLDRIALMRGRLKKGGGPDACTMAKTIIQDWQRGKIKFGKKAPSCV